MEISDERFIELFENVARTRDRIEEASRNWSESFRRLEKAHLALQRQVEELRAGLGGLEEKSAGDRRFLRGVWVGVSLVCGSLGSMITLAIHWLGTR